MRPRAKGGEFDVSTMNVSGQTTLAVQCCKQEVSIREASVRRLGKKNSSFPVRFTGILSCSNQTIRS